MSDFGVLGNPARSPADRVAVAAILLVMIGMAAVVGTALGYEYIGGYVPCKLCLAERQSYYLGVPIAAVAAISAWRGGPAFLTRGLMAVVGLAMLYTMALGIYHSGVEWAWWAGPTDCGAVADGVSKNAGDLFADLAHQKAPACDVAAGRFLGISFAGWNVVASAGLAAIAFWSALRRPQA